MLVSVTASFTSEVFITKDDLRVNAKSIMGVMMLAAESGSELTIEVEGPDEVDAMEAILKLIASGFEEES
jgi:phosphocarrier protein